LFWGSRTGVSRTDAGQTESGVHGSPPLRATVSDVCGRRLSAELAPSQFVIAVARVIDGVDDDARTERLDSLCDPAEPAKDRARQIAGQYVVPAGSQRYDIRGRPCPSEVCEHAVCGVAVNHEIDELETKLARELRGRSPTVHAGVVVDGHAVPNSEVDAHACRFGSDRSGVLRDHYRGRGV
jgi:hypothetical protein